LRLPSCRASRTTRKPEHGASRAPAQAGVDMLTRAVLVILAIAIGAVAAVLIDIVLHW
jgi:hypothetical protein